MSFLKQIRLLFGYDNKIIVITDSGIFKAKSKKDDAEKEDNLDNNIDSQIIDFIEKGIPNYTTIIFSETNINKTKKIYKCIDKKGNIIEFTTPSEAELVSYVISLSNKYNVKINKQIALYFVQVCNNDMDNIINEIRKLIEYTKSGNEIKKEYIDLITIKNIQSVIFDLTDNIGNRNTKDALNILDNLILQKEPLQKIYILIYKHFKNLYLVKYAKENNVSNINEVLGLHPFAYNKLLTQIKNYTLNELNSIYKEFMMIDIQNKSGNIDLYNGIVNTICKI